MDILFVVPYVPNLVRVRSYNLIRHLSARGQRVTVLTVWTNEQEREEAEHLRPHCHQVWAAPLPRWRSWWNCLKATPSTVPLQAVYGWQPELLAGLARHDLHFDVAHVEHLRGARYGLQLRTQPVNGYARIPIVWDSVDCISLLFRQAAAQSEKRLSRWVTRFELGRTARYEGWLLGRFDQVVVTSPMDREALVSLQPAGHPTPAISVIPNGVDLEYFTPGDGAGREAATLVISGKMSYHANVTMTLHLAKNILPSVWERHPEVKLWVVGQNPPHEIRALTEDPRITVTGSVSDIRPYLQRATAAVAPITYGAGIQNKVLEAMACATPVVATPAAVSALEVRPGQDVLVAQDPQAFAETVTRLLDDPAQQRRIGQAGRRYVEAHHQWDYIAGQLEALYHEVICTRR
jgi:sugar transferase (PEP-CTERM/EpsH1 system associated)